MDSKLELCIKDSTLGIKEDNVLKLKDECEPVVKKLKLCENEKINCESISHKNDCKPAENGSECKSIKNENQSTISKERVHLNTSENQSEKVLSKTGEQDDDEEMPIEHEIPKDGFDYPLEQDASDMLDEVDDFNNGHFPSVTERYFTPYYEIDVQKPGDDICIYIHSNRICMITLAPSHTIFQENKTIVSCDYQVSGKLNRLDNKVSGKSKHGAQPLQSNSNLCCLSCSDESSYMVKCCMIGKLVEVNERLAQNPELLKREPHYGGYIAIVLPNLKHLEKTKDKLLTRERYEEAMKKRKEMQMQAKEVTQDVEMEPVAKDKADGNEMAGAKEENHSQAEDCQILNKGESEEEEGVSIKTEVEENNKQV